MVGSKWVADWIHSNLHFDRGPQSPVVQPWRAVLDKEKKRTKGYLLLVTWGRRTPDYNLLHISEPSNSRKSKFISDIFSGFPDMLKWDFIEEIWMVLFWTIFQEIKNIWNRFSQAPIYGNEVLHCPGMLMQDFKNWVIWEFFQANAQEIKHKNTFQIVFFETQTGQTLCLMGVFQAFPLQLDAWLCSSSSFLWSYYSNYKAFR